MSHFTLQAKRATFTFWVDKSSLKIAKFGPFWRVFLKTIGDGQTVLPDRSLLIGQKLEENAKIKKIQVYILSGQKFIKNAKNGQK